ncbi:MAG TPA: hypothetical protein VKU62_09375 [Thermoanaerobaculia bacterium]|nr:hypothetical protein [Thermoanaerobaculia bacterium]
MSSHDMFTKKSVVVAVVVGAGATSFAARAETNDELEAKIEALQKEVRELSRKQQATDDEQAQVEKTAVVGGATKGSFKPARTRNQAKFGARGMRLFVKTHTPTQLGDLDTHVEFDFYGADGNESVSNSHGTPLRHAYATLGDFFAGRRGPTS